jgi:hypothetical protein
MGEFDEYGSAPVTTKPTSTPKPKSNVGEFDDVFSSTRSEFDDVFSPTKADTRSSLEKFLGIPDPQDRDERLNALQDFFKKDSSGKSLYSSMFPRGLEQGIATSLISKFSPRTGAFISGASSEPARLLNLEGGPVTTPQEDELMQAYPKTAFAGRVAGGFLPYAGAAMVGIPPMISFPALSGVGEFQDIRTDQEDLTPGQVTGRVGTAALGGLATAWLFGLSGELARPLVTKTKAVTKALKPDALAKAQSIEILAQTISGQAGSAATTSFLEDITKQKISGQPIDYEQAGANSLMTGLIVGSLSAFIHARMDNKGMQSAVLAEGKRLYKQNPRLLYESGGKTKTLSQVYNQFNQTKSGPVQRINPDQMTVKQATDIVINAGQTPGQLSPVFQRGSYQYRKEQFFKAIEKEVVGETSLVWRLFHPGESIKDMKNVKLVRNFVKSIANEPTLTGRKLIFDEFMAKHLKPSLRDKPNSSAVLEAMLKGEPVAKEVVMSGRMAGLMQFREALIKGADPTDLFLREALFQASKQKVHIERMKTKIVQEGKEFVLRDDTGKPRARGKTRAEVHRKLHTEFANKNPFGKDWDNDSFLDPNLLRQEPGKVDLTIFPSRDNAETVITTLRQDETGAMKPESMGKKLDLPYETVEQESQIDRKGQANVKKLNNGEPYKYGTKMDEDLTFEGMPPELKNEIRSYIMNEGEEGLSGFTTEKLHEGIAYEYKGLSDSKSSLLWFGERIFHGLNPIVTIEELVSDLGNPNFKFNSINEITIMGPHSPALMKALIDQSRVPVFKNLSPQKDETFQAGDMVENTALGQQFMFRGIDQDGDYLVSQPGKEQGDLGRPIKVSKDDFKKYYGRPGAAQQEAKDIVDSVQEKNIIDDLRMVGVSEENAKALMSGEKTPTEIVDDILGVYKPQFSSGIDAKNMEISENEDGTRNLEAITEDSIRLTQHIRNIGQFSHSQAIGEAREQAVNDIIDILDKSPVGKEEIVAPRPPTEPVEGSTGEFDDVFGPGINISSYESGLGQKLSNFYKTPVVFGGKTYKSSEEAYQANKSDLSDKGVLDLMVSVIKAKLTQHPEITDEITKAGGDVFLAGSTHNLIKDGKTIKTDRWTGKDGLFMQALRKAYASISTPTTVTETTDIIKRYDIRNNPDVIYLFGDNDLRSGLGGQAKEARNEPNAVGIRTKKKPSRTEDSYFTDSEYDENVRRIDNDFAQIPVGKSIVILPMGIGLAELPTRAPRTYAYLRSKIDALKSTAPAPAKPTGTPGPETPLSILTKSGKAAFKRRMEDEAKKSGFKLPVRKEKERFRDWLDRVLAASEKGKGKDTRESPFFRSIGQSIDKAKSFSDGRELEIAPIVGWDIQAYPTYDHLVQAADGGDQKASNIVDKVIQLALEPGLRTDKAVEEMDEKQLAEVGIEQRFEEPGGTQRNEMDLITFNIIDILDSWYDSLAGEGQYQPYGFVGSLLKTQELRGIMQVHEESFDKETGEFDQEVKILGENIFLPFSLGKEKGEGAEGLSPTYQEQKRIWELYTTEFHKSIQMVQQAANENNTIVFGAALRRLMKTLRNASWKARQEALTRGEAVPRERDPNIVAPTGRTKPLVAQLDDKIRNLRVIIQKVQSHSHEVSRLYMQEIKELVDSIPVDSEKRVDFKGKKVSMAQLAGKALKKDPTNADAKDILDKIKFQSHLRKILKIMTPDMTPEQLRGFKRNIMDYINRDRDIEDFPAHLHGKPTVVEFFTKKQIDNAIPEPSTPEPAILPKSDLYGQYVWGQLANSNPNDNDPPEEKDSKTRLRPSHVERYPNGDPVDGQPLTAALQGTNNTQKVHEESHPPFIDETKWSWDLKFNFKLAQMPLISDFWGLGWGDPVKGETKEQVFSRMRKQRPQAVIDMFKKPEAPVEIVEEIKRISVYMGNYIKWAKTEGLKIESIITRAVSNYVRAAYTTLDEKKQRLLSSLYDEILQLSLEEIKLNYISLGDGKIIQRSLTAIGKGLDWMVGKLERENEIKDSEKKANIEKRLEFHRRLQEIIPGVPDIPRSERLKWESERPELFFTNTLPDTVKEIQSWILEKMMDPAFFAMIDRGLMDRTNVVDKREIGYAPNKAVPREKRTSAAPSPMQTVDIYEKTFRTTAEFQKASGTGEMLDNIPVGGNMVIAKRASQNVGEYIAESHIKMIEAQAIESLKGILNPETGLGYVTFTPDVQKLIGPNLDAKAWLEQKEYEQLNAPGLRQYHAGAWQEPWVHRSVSGVLKFYYVKRTTRLPVQKLIKYFGIAKRSVMAMPQNFVYQVLSSGLMHLRWFRDQIPLFWAPYARVGPLLDPIASGIKGKFSRSKDLKKKYDPFFEIRTDDMFDLDKFSSYMQMGGRWFSPDWVAKSMYDSEEGKGHPYYLNRKDGFWSALGGKLGLDRYIFGSMIPRLMYRYIESIEDMMLKGKIPIGLFRGVPVIGPTFAVIGPKYNIDPRTQEEARRIAVSLAGTTSGMINDNVYGWEKNTLQLLLFARNFNVSLLQQLSGAALYGPAGSVGAGLVGAGAGFLQAGPVGAAIGGFAGLAGSRYLRKNRSFFAGKGGEGPPIPINILTHGTALREDLDPTGKFLTSHVTAILTTAYFSFGMVQLVLSLLGDALATQDPKKFGRLKTTDEKDRWIFNNARIIRHPATGKLVVLNAKKALQIRTPFQDNVGKNLYWDPLLWREAYNAWNLTTFGAVEVMSRKLGIGIQQLIDWKQGETAIGMALEGRDDLETEILRVNHFIDSTSPTFLQPQPADLNREGGIPIVEDQVWALALWGITARQAAVQGGTEAEKAYALILIEEEWIRRAQKIQSDKIRKTDVKDVFKLKNVETDRLRDEYKKRFNKLGIKQQRERSRMRSFIEQKNIYEEWKNNR